MLRGINRRSGLIADAIKLSVGILLTSSVGANANPSSLSNVPGDAIRGKIIVENRQQGLCVLCHQVPGGDERFQGNLAPTLAGVGRRLNEAQLRARMIDSRSINPESIMPSYFKVDGFERLAPTLHGKTLLTAQQIEDVVAYLKEL